MKWDELVDEKYLPYLIGGVAVVASVPVISYFCRRRQKIDVSKYPRDKVTLFQFRRGPRAPSLSPYCLKLETYLRMADIPYQNDFRGIASSKGKRPWIIYDGEVVADSQFCIKHLNQVRGVNLNAALSAEQQAAVWALQVMLEEHFVWVFALWRYDVGLNYPEAVRLLKRAFGRFATFLLPVMRYEVHRRAKCQGMGFHSQDEVQEIGEDDLRAVSKYLGNKPFISGSQPCENDCAIFAMLAQVYWLIPDSPYEKMVKEEFPNLGAYCERMKERFWPDWDDCITHDGTRRSTK